MALDEQPRHADADAALAALSQSCADALAAIGRSDPAPPPPLPLVLADVDALLALIHHTATKLALVFNPAAPSHAAAIPLLDDLAQRVPALAHCARLLCDDLHGAALGKDVRSRVSQIINALRALVQTFLDNTAGQEYLVKTATLHDLIAGARGPSGIPKDNQTAVRRAWKSDRDALEDSLQEVATMVSHAQSDDPAEQLDDGWHDLGLGHPTRMDEHELARAVKIHQLLRLTTLLHKRILVDLLTHPSSALPSAFDAFLAQSNLLLSTSDDLVSALYTPHDPSYLHAQILELTHIATSLRSQLTVFLPATGDLANQLRVLDLDSTTVPPSFPPKKRRADKKWFDTCVDQILSLSAATADSLSLPVPNITPQ